MKNVLAAVVLVALLAGTATAQQKQPKRTVNIKSSNGVSPMNDENGANKSAVSAQDDKTNVPAGVGGTPSGTGLTNDQNQAASSSATTRPAKLDANSSIRTGASDVKPKKKAPKPNN